MSSSSQFYRLIILSDRVVPGFAGIMRASMISGESLANRELKVIIASQCQVSEGKAINFAKKVTKYIRVNRRWSFVTPVSSPCHLRSYPLTLSSNQRPT
jgi:hypothetical protein